MDINLILKPQVVGSKDQSIKRYDAVSTAHIISHYEKDAEVIDYFKPRADPATAHEYKRLQDTIISKVNKESKIVLDIGCGRAWVADRLLPRGKTVLSFDVAPTNVEKALAAYPHDNHHGIVGDGLCLPLIDNSLDQVVCAEVIEHVEQPSRLIAEIVRVLKKGGQAIITTPYEEVIQKHLCIHCNQETPAHAHLHSFSKDSIIRHVPGCVSDAHTIAFSSKILSRLQSHKILQYLPYSLWSIIDRLMVSLFGKAERLMLIITK